jgi:hypothetical protein
MTLLIQDQLWLFDDSGPRCLHCDEIIPSFEEAKKYCSGKCRDAYNKERRKEVGANEVPTSVYQYYDADGILIYVGITGRGAARNMEHNKSKSWWSLVASQTVEHYKTRRTAEQREASLIRKMAPPFNVQHNRDHLAAKDAYLIRRDFGGERGLEALINGRNRMPAPKINTVGDRVTFALFDPRINFDEVDKLRVDGHGRKAKLLDAGVFADGSASWVRVVTREAATVTGAVVMYKFATETSWPAKVLDIVYRKDKEGPSG